jgi:hypothetical protein
MSANDGGPAFPRGATNGYGSTQEGMSLRDHFAGQALIALGAHKAVTARGIPWLVEHAYMVADAMLTERTKEQP